MYDVHNGDCRKVMAGMDAESVDAIVCDPPYGLSFMGKGWDHGVPGVEFWTEALRVAKPGAHLLAFGGTRTYHRLACAIEDAGWEIRDCVMWVYGSGFPKSHDVSKAIDKAAGAEREKEWKRYTPKTMAGAYDQRPWLDEARANGGRMVDTGTPATPAAIQWQGWGTALKPAWEPIIVARKPLVGTVAENVLAHGTGGINVDGCRVKHDEPIRPMKAQVRGDLVYVQAGRHEDTTDLKASGRWPANLIHDGSDEVVGLMGEAARFFYCAKASKQDRDEGCEGMPFRKEGTWGGEEDDLSEGKKKIYPSRNHHPTVKPTALMRYLCRLVTPPGGTVLDPFCGSGSTGKAAILEGFQFVGIEREDEYVAIAKARCSGAEMELNRESGQCYKRLHSGDDFADDLVANHGNSGNIRAKLENKPSLRRPQSNKKLHHSQMLQLTFDY
jgi:site-specific DNA-methyltransferase (adenine-specific)